MLPSTIEVLALALVLVLPLAENPSSLRLFPLCLDCDCDWDCDWVFEWFDIECVCQIFSIQYQIHKFNHTKKKETKQTKKILYDDAMLSF